MHMAQLHHKVKMQALEIKRLKSRVETVQSRARIHKNEIKLLKFKLRGKNERISADLKIRRALRQQVKALQLKIAEVAP